VTKVDVVDEVVLQLYSQREAPGSFSYPSDNFKLFETKDRSTGWTLGDSNSTQQNKVLAPDYFCCNQKQVAVSLLYPVK
jgi:hypothetical protein